MEHGSFILVNSCYPIWSQYNEYSFKRTKIDEKTTARTKPANPMQINDDSNNNCARRIARPRGYDEYA